MEEHGELLEAALADYDESDYKTIARVLPELVSQYATEDPAADTLSHGVGKAVEELKDLNVPARIAVLDWVVAQRAPA